MTVIVLIDYIHLIPQKLTICQSLNYFQSVKFHVFHFLNEKLEFLDIDLSKITQIIKTN